VRWTDVPSGTYTVTATAVNNRNESATAAAVNLTVNTPPTATLAASIVAARDPNLAAVRLESLAADADGSIARVEFYEDGILIGSRTAAPYLIPRYDELPGTYRFTARAIDNLGGVASSSTVTLTVPNVIAPPAPAAVTMTAPLSYTSYFAPADMVLEAAATAAANPIAQVDFYEEAPFPGAPDTFIGTASSPPYRFTWRNLPEGKYNILAKATDSQGVVTTSASVLVFVNRTRRVGLTSPVNNAAGYAAPASIVLAADVADSDGTMASVEFVTGTTVLATVTAAPYTARWEGVAKGSYMIRARATDRHGVVTLSAPVTVQVVDNAAPVIRLTSPLNNAAYAVNAPIELAVTASDADSGIVKVDFFDGATLLATVTQAPYTWRWSGALPGSHAITARATDSQGAQTTSTAITVTVAANAPPTVSITAPSNEAIFAAPAGIIIIADAADSDGAITRVEFYNGATLLGTSTAAPYSFVWSNVPIGTYSLTVKATDDAGVTTTSSGVNVTVGAVETITYLHNDFAGNPIAATDSNGVIVWKENYRPYGDRLGNDPAAANNRQWFHGKAVDVETGLSYFGARYYDATLGRFMGVDPVGFKESNLQSFNRYAYGNNNPYRFVDPDGREAELIAWITPLDMLNSRNRVVLEGGTGNGAGGVTTSGRSIFKEATPDAKAPVSGETKFTAAGRKAHQQEPLPSGFERDVVIPGTRLRMDGYNKETKEILELKPNNRRQIRRGEKQLEGYCKECDSSTLGPGHTTQPVQTYDPSKYLKED
jgi:RHS repeat-associated protein